MYKRRNFEVIVVSPPALASLNPTMTNKIANDFLNVLKPGNRKKLHLHSFSNGGFLFAGNLLHHGKKGRRRNSLEKDAEVNVEREIEFRNKINTIAIDCAPAALTPEVISKALASVLLGSRAEDLPDDGVGGFAKFALDTLGRTLMRDEKIKRKIDDAYAAWETELAEVPMQIFYSQSDELVPASEVEAFARRRKDNGGTIQLRMWENVPHCEIGRFFEDEYSEALHAFLDN